MLNDSPSRYGLVTRLLHWTTAVLIVLQLLRFLGKHIDQSHWINTTLKPLHGSIGATLLVIVTARLIWLLFQHQYRPKPEQFAKVAKSAHYGLYLLMFLMPLTGMAYVVGRGRAVVVFGQEVIAARPPNFVLEAFGSYHPKIAWILLILAIGHMCAALYHHFYLRDDTLKRML